MTAQDPVMIVSDNSCFRDLVWKYFHERGFSVNLERDLDGVKKRVSDGIYKIVILDAATIESRLLTKGEEQTMLKDWESFWKALEDEWNQFESKLHILVLDVGEKTTRFEIGVIKQRLDEIVQANFFYLILMLLL